MITYIVKISVFINIVLKQLYYCANWEVISFLLGGQNCFEYDSHGLLSLSLMFNFKCYFLLL